MQAHYLSWTSQTDFLNACGKQIQDAVVKESKNALYYSVIVDGTPDVSGLDLQTKGWVGHCMCGGNRLSYTALVRQIRRLHLT